MDNTQPDNKAVVPFPTLPPTVDPNDPAAVADWVLHSCLTLHKYRMDVLDAKVAEQQTTIDNLICVATTALNAVISLTAGAKPTKVLRGLDQHIIPHAILLDRVRAECKRLSIALTVKPDPYVKGEEIYFLAMRKGTVPDGARARGEIGYLPGLFLVLAQAEFVPARVAA